MVRSTTAVVKALEWLVRQNKKAWVSPAAHIISPNSSDRINLDVVIHDLVVSPRRPIHAPTARLSGMESERELTQAYNKLREKQAIGAHDCCDKGQFLQQVRPKKGKKGKLIKQNRKRPSRPFKIGNNSQAKQKHEWESG